MCQVPGWCGRRARPLKRPGGLSASATLAVSLGEDLSSTMTIHGLQAACITQARRLGIPIATVAAGVGHESPPTTLRHYTASTRAEIAEAAARVSEWIASRG